MMVPEGDVDILARAMIEYHADAADRAALRSNAFAVLGHLRLAPSGCWSAMGQEDQAGNSGA
jgi:hypothetical protein